MRFKAILITCIITISATGQLPVSFIEIDTASYGAYINGDWQKIIEIGNNAFNNNIDYYYLRLRVGYAFFMQNKYGKAIPHYKKALEFSDKDAIALEYLYYCYLYSARQSDADKLLGQIPESLKTYIIKDNSSIIKYLGFNITYANGAADKIKNDIIQTVPIINDGVQKVHNNFINYNLSLGHSIGNSISVHHSIDLLNRDEFALTVINSTPYLSESQILKQFNYNIGIEITPVIGFKLKPAFSYIQYRIPLFNEYGSGYGNNREVIEYKKYTDYAYGLQAIKYMNVFRVALAGSYSDLNLSQQITGAASGSIFPFGNLNLYYSLSGYYLSQKAESISSVQFIHKHELGFKVTKHLWIELFSILGEFTNFYDPFSEIAYNSLEQYNLISGGNLIIPFYKSGISLFAKYRYYQSESSFVPFNNPLNYTNNKQFNYQTISGGIKWKL